ncbi:MAG: flagellar biosynthetic protein FlhB [Burkholderiales bacterium 68-12]|nr:EscU/YscU/HrcU family type III secretion system export apparatus switch protein [Burkholderiales bacterium]OJX28509.1 MAG: flagellar biosynthetic protein FlhB [Burkholderiales bacterium 68-12]
MESSQERNLPATERKLQKARTDGQAPRSRDLSHLAILGAGALALLALTPALLEHLLRGMGQQLAFDAQTVQSPASMLARLQSMAAVGLIASGVFSALTAAAALLAAVLAGGWIFSTKPIAPQFNRLNPLSGLANLFSKQQMVNVAKMVLLTGVLTGVAWKYLSGSIDEVAVLVLQPSSAALRHVADWLTQGLGLLLLVVFLAALVDVPLQALLFKNRLKMSHEEIKQEHKESEGSPQIKSRIRQRQREIADRASITAVPQADFVVMNPTHYAVALRYDDQAMNAPQVIARGTDLLAFKIRDIAQNHDIPVLQSPALARALYAHAELDQPIPAPLYTAVAQVLAYVYRLKAALRGQGRMPGAQPDPYVPPELDPLQRATHRGPQP